MDILRTGCLKQPCFDIIFSLSINFYPYDGGFLPGGGMANLFKALPHLLGTITNLDGNQSMRVLPSIHAEYRPEKDESGIEDHTIYLINDLYDKKFQLCYEILFDCQITLRFL